MMEWVTLAVSDSVMDEFNLVGFDPRGVNRSTAVECLSDAELDVGRATDVDSMFQYRTGMRFFDHGYAAAQGFLLLIIVSVIVSLLFGRIRSLYEEA